MLALRLFRGLTAVTMRSLGARPSTERIRGYDVRVWRVGPFDAEPTVLLHGLGSTSLSWKPVVAALSRGRRLIVPELSSLGGTRGPRPGLDVADGAAVVAELIQGTTAAGRAAVCGISLGAWIAVRLALERPELVDRLVLINAAGYRDQDWDRIRELVTVSDAADVDALYAALFVRAPWTLRLVRAGFRRAYGSTAVRSILGSLDEADAYGDDDLARITAPTHLIWAERDGLFELAVARAMERSIPGARLQVLEGCAHAVQWERPGALVDAVRRAELDSRQRP